MQLFPAAGSQSREAVARIIRSPSTIFLQLTAEGLRLGILEACIIATAIMQCGRRID